MDGVAVDGRPARGLVGGQEALDAAQTACTQTRRGAESPGADAEPGQIFVDLAEVYELPVEHGREVRTGDDEIAHPEIAVDQPVWRRLRSMLGKPAECPLERRCGVTYFVELIAPLGERVLVAQGGIVGWGGAVDGGQRVRALGQ